MANTNEAVEGRAVSSATIVVGKAIYFCKVTPHDIEEEIVAQSR